VAPGAHLAHNHRVTSPLLFGHRGAPRERPENTLPSFARALELGVDALETDVHMTADGHIVVSHDPDGGRAAGVATAFRRATLAEVQSWDAGRGFVDDDGGRPFAGRGIRVPTLEQVLIEFPDTPLNVDIKQVRPSMVPRLIALLRRLRAEERVRLASFSLRPLASVRARDYAGETALSELEVRALLLTPMFLFRRLPGTGTAVQIPDRAGALELGCPEIIDKCHRLGLRVDFWTIDDPARARELLRRGADGIMTDDPATIAPVFAALRRRHTGNGERTRPALH
jgi:glycerophosphoryl diester phosphodiesterase